MNMSHPRYIPDPQHHVDQLIDDIFPIINGAVVLALFLISLWYVIVPPSVSGDSHHACQVALVIIALASYS